MTWGVYVHIPFCARACPYCAHYKVESANPALQRRLVEALLLEARMEAPRWRTFGPPRTVFLGGGTPSLLSAPLLSRLIQGLQEELDFSQVEEFTVEMNPEHVTPQNLAFLQTLGVNRVSVGVQSFRMPLLRFLGRTHTPEILDRALTALATSRLKSWSLDLMFGMAGQRPEDFAEDLDRALAFRPPHLSTYELTIEPGTLFHIRAKRGERLLADETTRRAMYILKEEVLSQAGLVRYEISNHARPGHAARHNLLYWRRQNVLGLGPGAASLRGRVRWTNHHNLTRYLEHLEQGSPPPRSVEHLSPREILLERVFLGLRLREGLALPRDLRPRVMEELGDLVEATPMGIRLSFPEGILRTESVALRVVELWEQDHERMDARTIPGSPLSTHS